MAAAIFFAAGIGGCATGPTPQLDAAPPAAASPRQSGDFRPSASPHGPTAEEVVELAPYEDAAEPPRADGHHEGERGPQGGTLFEPISGPIVHGRSYRFSLGHCGLDSPVDADGSFWDFLGAVDGSGARVDREHDDELINATQEVIVVSGDRAVFRTLSGTVVTFSRHDGAKAFPACA